MLSDMIKLQHDTKNLVEGEVRVLEKSVAPKFLFEDPPSLQVSEEVLDLDSVLTDCLISFLVPSLITSPFSFLGGVTPLMGTRVPAGLNVNPLSPTIPYCLPMNLVLIRHSFHKP